MRCPVDDQLLAFFEGYLPVELRADIENHFLHCLNCQARLPRLNLQTPSVLTSLQREVDSRFEFIDEPECIRLLEFGKSLNRKSWPAHLKTTIVINKSQVNRGTPSHIGRYQIIKHLGAGSFGTVLLARDEQLDRHVAIKISHPTRIKSPEDADRYQREARLLAKMEHPSIVPVYDSGLTDDGLVYIVSRFIRGNDLSQMMRPERFPTDRAIRLTISIANALYYMHSHGIVHRDIKPANILLNEEGIPFLTDFGLAIHADEILGASEIVGTLAYMSPEQLSGDGHLIGPRSDLFSLGVILFELLTGERPFKDRERNGQVNWMLAAPSPTDLNELIPLPLDRICQKALQSRSADRYASALELVKDLTLYLNSPQAGTEPGQQPKPIYRGLRAFRKEDREFFAELIPGLRSAQGNPEPVQFWLNRLGTSPDERHPRIGVIYGTTGSGKSSMIHAAILPKLNGERRVITIQATASRTETDLMIALKQVFLKSQSSDSLPEICRQIRTRHPPFANERILIVIDQFEQWLHGRKIDLTQELVQALRQCDGLGIQCLLIVRDDFWVELSKFMRTVEEPMREGENMMAIEPFTTEHAEAVLFKIGTIVKQPSKDQQTRRKFIERGIEIIQTEGYVPPVRLALFVEITKDFPWEAETIRHFNDLNALVQTYLKQRFNPEICPRRYRHHLPAIKLLLAALLPERGLDLKGQGRSLDELQMLCGNERSPERFSQLIDLLDRDLRIISPIAQVTGDVPNSLHYQLTHDYLVPGIRAWLVEEQVKTYRGRAKLKLQARTSMWSLKQEARQLPGVLELLNILTGTTKKEWTREESTLMRTALRHLLGQSLILSVLLFMISGIVWFRVQAARDETFIQQLAQSSTLSLPALLQQTDNRLPRLAPKIQSAYAAAELNSKEKRHLGLAILRFDQAPANDIKQSLLDCQVDEFAVISSELRQNNIPCSEMLSVLNDNAQTSRAKFRAACLLLKSADEAALSDSVMEAVVSGLVKQTPPALHEWSKILLPYRQHLTARLMDIFNSEHPFEPQNAAFALSHFLHDDPESYANLLMQANHHQLPILCEAIKSDPRSYTQILTQRLSQLPHPGVNSDLTQTCNLLTALAYLGQLESLPEALRRSANPAMRNLLIHQFAETECDPQRLIAFLKQVKDPDLISALLLSLGSYQGSILGDTLLDDLRLLALGLFRNHPDSEVHSASQWLLKRFGENATMPAVSSEEALRQEQGWFVLNTGQTFAIPCSEVRHLQDAITSEKPDAIRLTLDVDWSFAISTTEVTVQQYLKSAKHENSPRQHINTEDCPITNIDYYSAMAYCNWLTLEEGLPVAEQCYEIYKERYRPKQNFIQLKGFRLPTNEEWEVAVRGGTLTPYHFGATGLISEFSWHAENSESRVHPVGLLKPNQIGLFDVSGNVVEWCHEISHDMEANVKSRKIRAPSYRGGSYQSFSSSSAPDGSMRSSENLIMSPRAALSYTGFRVAKTIHFPEN